MPVPINARAPVVSRPDGLAVLIAAGGAALTYGVGIALLMASRADSATAGVTQYLVSGLAPIVAVAIAYVARIRSLGTLGFRRISVRWIVIAVGAGVLTILLNIAVTVIVVLVSGPPSDIQQDYHAASSGGPLLLTLTLLAGAVLTPLGEELLFRGVLANWLLRFGGWVAVPVSAGVFALAHGVNYILPVAFVVGVITALLFRATRSIWPGIVVHAVNNGYTIVAVALTAGAAS